MKIDGTSLSAIGSIQATNKVSSVAKKNAAGCEDKVIMSDKGQIYQTLTQKTQALPPIRQERVQELVEQIARGEFNVDSVKIAENLAKFSK